MDLTYSDGVVSGVALRKESVDRNCTVPPNVAKAIVALRKESVDRNAQHFGYLVAEL